MENLLIFFIVVTALAVVLQAAVLVSLYLSLKKTSDKVESLAGDVHQRVLPVLTTAHEILSSSRHHLFTIGENLSSTSATLRVQAEKVDSTVTDALDRTRLLVARADEMVGHTLDRVEQTTELVQDTVISPIKQVAGIVGGVRAGFNAIFGSRRRSRQQQDEELFI